MKLLHIAPYTAPAFAFGGVPRAVDGLTRALARAGHEVTALVTDAGAPGAAREDISGGVRIVRARNLSPWARARLNLSSPLGLPADLRRLLPLAEVAHLHELRTIENLLAAPMLARAGLPIVLSPHGTLTPTTGRPLLKRAWDALLTPATALHIAAVVGLTGAERDEAQAAWPAFTAVQPQFAVIPNGVDLADFAALPEAAPYRARWGLAEAPTVLFLGRLHPRKGAVVLAEAFALLPQLEANLLIAGGDEGALPALVALAARDRRIRLVGHLSGPDRLGALACADLFALPAIGEGLPMAALEAMACRLPLLLSPGCNLPEAEAAGAAVVVPPSAPALAAALGALLADSARCQAMGAAGRALVGAQYTWDAVAAAYGHLYAGLAEPG